jgi:hypothetical protein
MACYKKQKEQEHKPAMGGGGGAVQLACLYSAGAGTAASGQACAM